jgi:uncharacterized protein (DUF1499 family)
MADAPRDWLDFASFERAPRPNSALACSPDICTRAEASQPTLTFDADPTRVVVALRAIEPSVEVQQEPSGDIRARFVAVTRLMRFKDDVDFLIRPAEGGSRVAIYSRSRVGYSDLGTNARRVATLEQRLRAELARG